MARRDQGRGPCGLRRGPTPRLAALRHGADVFQEVFQTAFAKLDSFEHDRPGGTFRGWLRTITRNKVHDHYRRQKRQPPAAGGTEIQVRMGEAPDSPRQEPQPSRSPAETRLFLDALDGVRHRFHERTWKAFLSTAVDGRPTKDVAYEGRQLRPTRDLVDQCILQAVRRGLLHQGR
ncbi:MAG: hypothetical protein GY711_16635 [bacterium]|nr:hypothetical protein [bacterium]